ncbi:sirohydrochlorin chelatase [Micromonospora echinofusca]|uniref:Cobalamin biosynthesis protein CbiX n=1 Tax=Micromonospora echinofusca TaxID=47858 RepID=A0ABS3VPW0_MICEH|nr:CbiX/SirB N-terminal domain-containing protein [Micromonospora echinofusca]MBO4206579.1 cobalamin biosynthesis protein CbiX [Micromonospora echinofusca]
MRAAPLTPGPGGAVVLVAHGSRDPRAAASTRALVRAVRTAVPDLAVRESYLDHTSPAPDVVLGELEADGHPVAFLVPLLLTAAYHGRVDVPAAVAQARSAGLRMPVRVTRVLGPEPGPTDGPPVGPSGGAPVGPVDAPPVGPVPGSPARVAGQSTGCDPVHGALLAGLRRRLTESAPDGFDGVVLAAAGTRDAAARLTVERAAAVLGASLGVPCVAAYASAASPTADVAVEGLRAAGARRVAAAAYFLAPGRLYDVAAAAARDAGAVAVAAPLGDAPELVELILSRVGSVIG